MKSIIHKLARWLPLAAIALLAGCASTYTLENTVQSFSQVTALPQPATYRFDRLPSQQDPAHMQLEAMADAALNAAGLRRDDASPRLAVQISARLERTISPWADPWDRFGWGWGPWGGRRHGGWGMHGGYSTEPSWYHREVNVVVRDLGTNRVVYESRAISDGPYYDNEKVFPAMFGAVMQGFPNPPAGPRRVDVVIPS